MVFNSLQFLLFFTSVSTLFFNLPQRFRPAILLIASCYFYMCFLPVYLLIMTGTIAISYFIGLKLSGESRTNNRVYLIIGLLLVIGVLAFFKYYISYNEFLVNLLYGKPKSTVPIVSILLPVGLSFHTFQVISYMIEVYRKKIKPERNFGIYSLYVMFFPQLVAGPIERPQNLIPQFRIENNFDFENFKSGVMMMAFGFFKKVVIADRLAIVVNASYGSAAEQSGFALLVATLLYSIQLYCDFSGYSEIAVGTAKIMGFKLTDNFKAPYFSKSITEFWTKWHISLSTWLRDYLFLPIAYKVLRVVKKKKLGLKPEVWSYVIAALLTMFIAGIWHGDAWTFAIWGLLHGTFIVASFVKSRIYKKFRIKISQGLPFSTIKVITTFLLVSFAWIFFRAPDLSTSFLIISKIFSVSVFSVSSFALNSAELIFCVILIIFLFLKEKLWLVINVRSNLLFYTLILLISSACYLFGVFEQSQFLYFQF